jgi:hypothetical protein
MGSDDYRKFQVQMYKFFECTRQNRGRLVYTDKVKEVRLGVQHMLASDAEMLADFESLFRNVPDKTVEEIEREQGGTSTDGTVTDTPSGGTC